MQIDSTPLDVMVLLDDDVTGQVELTALVDIATRSITAARKRKEDARPGKQKGNARPGECGAASGKPDRKAAAGRNRARVPRG